jgi:DnaK suppressor protein
LTPFTATTIHNVQRRVDVNTKAPTKQDLRVYRQRLQKLADRLSGGVAELTAEATRPTGAEGTVADSPAHEPTATSTEADEEVARAALMSEGQLLAEARDALARLDAKTFGWCEKCGRAISKTRLDVIPYARFCIRCAQAAEGGMPN